MLYLLIILQVVEMTLLVAETQRNLYYYILHLLQNIFIRDPTDYVARFK